MPTLHTRDDKATASHIGALCLFGYVHVRNRRSINLIEINRARTLKKMLEIVTEKYFNRIIIYHEELYENVLFNLLSNPFG